MLPYPCNCDLSWILLLAFKKISMRVASIVNEAVRVHHTHIVELVSSA